MNRQKASQAPPVWLIRATTNVHKFLHCMSGGLLFNQLLGDDVCFVSMTGAKSGRRITVPLMHVPYREGVLLVASQGGSPNNPNWYYNLCKHPEIEVNYRGTRKTLLARLATSDEKETLWPTCDAHYAPYADYRSYTDRDIPIFVCEPQRD